MSAGRAAAPGLPPVRSVRAGAGGAAAAALAVTLLRGPVQPATAAAFAAIIAVGELVRTPAPASEPLRTAGRPGDRERAPLAAAGALAYALLGADHGERTQHGVLQVVAVVGTAVLLGGLPRAAAAARPHRELADLLARRVATAGFAATLFQPLHHAGVLERAGLRGPLYGLLLAACAALAALCDTLLSAALRREPGGLGRRLRDELAGLAGIGSAITATGMVLSLAVGEVGLWALPMFSVPLLLSQLAFRRHAAVRATQAQTIGSLARATEVAGYTRPGHAERVCALARETGRELGLGARELEILECAALVHDVGQLSLVDPVPGGATVLLPHEEQRRIARLGSEVVRQAGLPPEVARIVACQAEPYRRPDGSRDRALPLAARVVRVANAYTDLDCEGPHPGPAAVAGPARRLRALEQLRLGTGREYEPRVVEALVRVCTRS